jgi:hypothetical protein
MALLPQFDPPANIDDLNATQRRHWSEFIDSLMERSRQGDFEGTRPQFYNPTRTDTAADAATVDISWRAFPNVIAVTSASDRERWTRAEASRDVQDEYCEWSVTRDPATGKITRLTFTCEGPEYWQFLARVNPQKVLQLYQRFVDPSIQITDLFRNGQYNPRNRFNNSTTRGAMHLIQRNNTLGAEIEIVAAATVLRLIDGRLLSGEAELIECGRYGVPERNSDPHIGGEVNALARQNADVTIQNPVGLYIAGLSTVDFSTPDGSDPQDYWRIVRGTADRGLRAVYEVPGDKGFVVGDITIAGEPIDFGAQITDFIQIKVTGLACRFGQSTAEPRTSCVGALEAAPALAAAVGEDVSVEEALGGLSPRLGRGD